MTPEQQAIQIFLSKPAPYFSACGCMGAQRIDRDDETSGRYPVCPCEMQYVSEVDGQFYRVFEHRAPTSITHTAELLGPIGGPYAIFGNQGD